MALSAWIENVFMKTADAVCSRWPQPLPDPDRLERCRLISHRGEHDNRMVFENTLAALEAAASGGVWGIEFDLRWTKDLRPVVFHDRDTRRLFGSPGVIREMNFAELLTACPLIPRLEEVVERFGTHVHLMIEIKQEPYPDTDRQNRVLAEILKPLQPAADYHLISLSPHMFDRFDFIPADGCLPIAQQHVTRASEHALRRGYGGLLGHYLLITRRIARRHRDRGQRIGTGFADFRNCLLREINRGVEWIFSNRAVPMQAVIDTLAKHQTPVPAQGEVANPVDHANQNS
jgi:glycerophosphoryl diester phosphodiesterase